MPSEMKLTVYPRTFPLAAPFAITGYTFTHLECVWVELEQDGAMGRGEGTGSYYLGESQDSLMQQIESMRPIIEAGVTRDQVNEIMPRGGARNALDCALWDLACKQQNTSIWDTLSLNPRELITVATIGVASPEEMAEQAARWADFPALKLKLDGELVLERVRAIREARGDAKLVIDVNQGWTMEELVRYTPPLHDLDVSLIEQPLARGADEGLLGYTSLIPLGADESCLGLSDYEFARERYDVINVKLDKCGGLTEALKIVTRAHSDGVDLMVGNMTGTSLSMAPSFVVGQHCVVVDIDGPLLLEADIDNGLEYRDGGIVGLPRAELWG